MYIIISPAKTFKIPDNTSLKPYVPLTFHEATRILVKQLSQYTVEDLKQLMKMSEALAEVNEARYKAFFNPSQDSYEAIYAFYGEVYKALQVESLDHEAISFMQNHMGILSGLYGLIKPLDRIQAYRLEMGTTLSVGEKKNLYEFWKDDLTKYVLAQLERQKEKGFLVNLASEEYSKVLDLKAISKQYPVIQMSFKEASGENYRVVGMYAKKARGQMLRFICENKIEQVEELKQFSGSGYSWNKALSTEKHLVFTRNK